MPCFVSVDSVHVCTWPAPNGHVEKQLWNECCCLLRLIKRLYQGFVVFILRITTLLLELAFPDEISVLGFVSFSLSYSSLNLNWKGTGWYVRIFRVLPKDSQMYERRTVSGADVGKRIASCKTPPEKQAALTVITSVHLHSGVIRRAEQKQGQHIVLRTLLYRAERSLELVSI